MPNSFFVYWKPQRNFSLKNHKIFLVHAKNIQFGIFHSRPLTMLQLAHTKIVYTTLHKKKDLGLHRKPKRRVGVIHVWKFRGIISYLPYLLHPQYSQDFARTIIPTGVTLCTITFATYLQIQLFHSPRCFCCLFKILSNFTFGIYFTNNFPS